MEWWAGFAIASLCYAIFGLPILNGTMGSSGAIFVTVAVYAAVAVIRAAEHIGEGLKKRQGG